jgi:hypothetical protein
MSSASMDTVDMASNGDRTSGIKRKHKEGSELATNGVDKWKESMKKYILKDLLSTDVNVMGTAMAKLADILFVVNDTSKRTERQKYFFVLGGHHAIVVRVMSTITDLKHLQYNGIAVLLNASYNNKEASEAIVEVEGFEVILSAMKKHHSDAAIQIVGTKALCSLVFYEANAELFVSKHDGITFLLQQMENFSNTVNLIEQTCFILNIISSYDKFRKSLVDANAIITLASVIICHSKDSKIGECAHRVILNLTKSNE